jgi:vacuolar-type H+-ATPase subunit I/STV1
MSYQTRNYQAVVEQLILLGIIAGVLVVAISLLCVDPALRHSLIR